LELKNLIVADWDQIVNEPRHWVPLPRSPTIASILETFLATKRDQRRDQLGKWEELVEALSTYFDVALPKVLLYRQEREQYERYKPTPDASGPPPSAIYGAEHLLRLLTILPTLLTHTNLDSGEVPQVQSKLADFLRFLVRHQADLFLRHYVLRETVLGGFAAVNDRGRGRSTHVRGHSHGRGHSSRCTRSQGRG
jgi:mortality factor 4-like protein 1